MRAHLKNNLTVYYLLLSGSLLRLIFASFPSFHIDADTNFAWSLRVFELGFGHFYSKDVWTNYTPGMIYVFYLLAAFKNLFSLSDSTFYLVLKIPSIVADLLLCVFVYKQLLKTTTAKLALYGFLICLFNPVFIFNSAIWGAFDAPMTLFAFLSVYFLSQKKLIHSSIAYGMSILVKPQTIALAPVFALFLFKNLSSKNILKLFLPGLLAIVIFSVPFFPSDPLLGFFKLFIQMTQDYNGNSLFAYNLWGIFGFWVDDNTKLGFLSYRNWGILLLIIYWGYIFAIYLKRKIDLFTLSTLAFLAFFFLPTRVHERYLFPALPFLYLISLQYKSRILLSLSIVMTGLHLFNLYYVYVYYNEFYLKLSQTLYIKGFYETLENSSKLLSFVSTLVFALIILVISKLVLKSHEYHKS